MILYANGRQVPEEPIAAFHDDDGTGIASFSDDAGNWRGRNVTSGSPGRAMSEADRRWHVQRARNYAARDPLCSQTYRLWVNYSIGRGVEFAAKDKAAKTVLDRFWNHPQNRNQLRYPGQERNARRLLVDGELFFALFDIGSGKQRSKLLRVINPLEITEIISNPVDVDDVWYYKRESSIAGGSKTEKRYYPSVFAGDNRLAYQPEPDETILKYQKPNENTGDDPQSDGAIMEENGSVLHVAINTIDQRGVPLLAGAIDWSKAMARFMDARMAIQQSLAQFAWKEKLIGNAADVSARIAAERSTLSTGGPNERNPAATSGSTWIENQGLTREPMRQATAGADAKVDAAAIVQMFASGSGIFPHYFGLGESYRLATATAMEAPMMKQFEGYQAVWTDTFATLFEILLAQAEIPQEKRAVDIDYSPVLDTDRQVVFDGIEKIIRTFPYLAGSSEMATRGLVSLGLNHASEIVKREQDNATEARDDAEPSEQSNDEQPLQFATEAEAVALLGEFQAALNAIA